MIFAFKLALLDVWYLQFSEYLNTIFTKKKKKKKNKKNEEASSAL